ncbi:uncharacterized protein LOC106667597 [Cimex lectularius]|uniref:RING-CH-type domain-containing protein n=1 Tax=Cimex lectularius TaxID=79782 RepID=A0A8I6RRI5_CIMLE|nr:uncharacterized protein LOC106667597 [Cimex lectularius]
MTLQQTTTNTTNPENGTQLENHMYVHSSKSQESCRSESQTSSHTSTNVEICRICHCEGDAEGGLIAPCYCAGSLRYVHQACLQQWIKSSNIRCCELCKFQFIMHTKTKPFMEWEPLEMTGFERRKLLCAVLFHAIALTCVIWSLYVLIHRTAEEIRDGILEWPFWTKLIVVAIGFTGGVVFMYIQCKAYMHICQRWKAFNRVIYVQNAPEKNPLQTQTVPPLSPNIISGTSHKAENISKLKNFAESGNFKDETSIDLKGVRNLHIFFNDESSVCVQNEQFCGSDEGDGTLEAVNVTPNGNQRCEDLSTSWHIKIGKSSGGDQSYIPVQQRSAEEPGKSSISEYGDSSADDGITYKAGDAPCGSKNDSVLKLQTKKAEIVIKFKQSSMDDINEEVQNKDRKDTSVNIKIDDNDNDPIVIDVVTKGQTETSSSKDPVKISFGFKQNDEERVGDKTDCCNSNSTNKLFQTAYLDDSCAETDAASHLPLLPNKCPQGKN